MALLSKIINHKQFNTAITIYAVLLMMAGTVCFSILLIHDNISHSQYIIQPNLDYSKFDQMISNMNKSDKHQAQVSWLEQEIIKKQSINNQLFWFILGSLFYALSACLIYYRLQPYTPQLEQYIKSVFKKPDELAPMELGDDDND